LAYIGPEQSQRVALDLSREMLLRVDRRNLARTHRVRGDGVHPPLARAAFANVAVLGNSLGFAAGDSDRLLGAAEELVTLGGNLLLEVVAGPGERARYLHRLPPSSLARLLRSPVRAVYARTQREGFAPDPPRRSEPGEFHRFRPRELSEQLEARGWATLEIVAVAPSLGASPAALEAVHPDPKAWSHLIELEELVGHEPERWTAAAAVLIALSRLGQAARTIK